MHETEDHRRADQIDAKLRETLEPDKATVDRLVASALSGPDRPLAKPRRWRVPARRWQLTAAAAAVAVLAVIALPTLFREDLPPETGRDAPVLATASDSHAALRISNEDGPITVTTAAGSKMVFLPLVFN